MFCLSEFEVFYADICGKHNEQTVDYKQVERSYKVVEVAAARELFEETGLLAHSLELFGVFSGEDMAYTYPNGDVVSNVDIVFICREYDGTLNPQAEEVTELRFFPIRNLPSNIFEANIPALHKLTELYLNHE